MPALAAVPGVARVVCRGTSNGQPVVNVFHVQNGSVTGATYSAAGIAALTTAFATAYQANFLTRVNSSYSGDDVTATDLSSPTGRTSVATLSVAGSGGAGTIPQSAAACVTWKIDRHYRGGHPRTYIGPLAATALENSISLAAAFVTSLQTSATNFLTAVNAITADGLSQVLVCVHREVAKAPLAVPLVDPITGSAVDSRIDSMRRRLGPDR
jgi:hypothetical protein